MHKFLVKVVSGKIVPVQPSKDKLLNKMLKDYEALNKKFYITLEDVQKDINQNQTALYRAYIIKSAEYFGYTYHEMEKVLKELIHPINIESNDPDYLTIPVERWSSAQLDNFLNQANSVLSEHGFKF